MDEYSGNSYKFPDPDVAPENKQEASYVLKTLQAMYSSYCNGRTAITPSDHERFSVNRKYGEGNQPTSYYENLLINSNDDNVSGVSGGKALAKQRREGWASIDFDNPITYAPKVRDHLHGMFREMEQDVIGYPIDKDSMGMMKDMKLELETRLKFQEQIAELQEAAGVNEQFDFFPLDQAELDLYEASGGFKLNFAKAMEKLLSHTFKISNYEQLKENWIDDVKDYGFVVGRDAEDIDTNETKADWVDVMNFTCQHSKYADYRDIDYAFEIKQWTISELGTKIEDLDELIKYAKLYVDKMGNPGWSYWKSIQNNISFEDISDFRIPVLEGTFIDFEDTYSKEYVNKYGKRRILPAKYKEKSKTNNYKIRTVRRRHVYEGKWVLGSEKVFDYGKCYYQNRQKGKDVQLPYTVIFVTTKPITERLRPIYDQMAIAWFKFQNAQAMAANSGYAINTRLLENVNMGGEKADPKELVRMAIETGYWFYSDLDLATEERYQGGAVHPIQEVSGGMKNDLPEGIQKIQWAISMIEHIAGISDVSMGAQAKSDSQVGTTQMSVMGSQNVIRPMVRSIMDLKGEMAKRIMYQIQLRVKHDDQARKMYEEVVGDNDIAAIKMATKRGARFGIHFEPRPTQQELQELYTMISQSMGAGKDGQPLLEADEALMIRGELMNGANLKDVRLKLSYKIRKRKEEQRRYAMATQEQANKHTLQQNQQKFEQEMYKEQFDKEYQMKETQMKMEGDMAKERLKQNNELKQLILRLSGDEQRQELEQQFQLQMEEYK